MEANGVQGLFPAGEGAGFAGGIVSAAVDGLNVAQAIIEQLMGSRSSSSTESSSQHQDSKRSKRAVKNAGDLY
eukprot:CAMPEP_0198152404 /NCGR_PEP_ID=MMETSP1443-20131203/59697_1 /TAXON_ID=186043 /ORGANISM="Entomoneis sp., Strain CCMP2396" /LENGTH=72 /DNA_ID=CAMNT_0043818417 /DNA_START=42 /DNA_END=260 /DNA_ORIENTATION=-